MHYKEVEFDGIGTVRVYAPPTRRILSILEKKHPRPAVPIARETTATGKEIEMRIEDDPAYLAKVIEWEELINEEADRMGSLFMFKDLTVPEGWSAEEEVGAEVHFFDPDWKPEEGDVGRKLDYIQWVVLGPLKNQVRLTDALRELSGIDLDEVNANEATF